MAMTLPAAALPSTAAVSPDEVAARFASLLATFDFEEEFQILALGRFQRAKRKTARRELRALYIALWRLALERSFPIDYAAIAQTFLERLHENLSLTPEDLAFLLRRVDVYVTLVAASKADNFLGIADDFLTSATMLSTSKDLRLKVSLHLRKIFTFIFNNLI